MIKLQNLIGEGVYDPGILKAVFLAGGPGSGKTTTANQLFGVVSNSFSYGGLKPVNSDKFFEFLLKKHNVSGDLASLPPEEFEKVTVGPTSLRGQAKTLSDKNYNILLQGRMGVLIDSTGDDPTKITKHAEKLKQEYGYDVYMVFVNTPLQKALDRNDGRARKLPHNLVTTIWNSAQNAKKVYEQYFGESFVEVMNDKDVAKGQPLDIDSEVQKRVDRFIKEPVMNPSGKEWIRQALAAKKINEIDSGYKIYCDMDGVLCDFIKQWKKFYGEDAKAAKKLDKQKFDDMLNNAPFEFWSTMEWMPGSKRMWDIISRYGVTILSSPADSTASTEGKQAWIQKNIPGTPVIFAKSYDKQKYAEPDAILIDDYERNISQWKNRGGIDVHYKTAEQVIRDLSDWDIR